ncbi:MAG: heat-inducible transcriptional repressor HrcA [Myxococcota bacterium]|nr:heat-inducible transcription repressor HrcA [Deltaproteobacteria bacterium]MCP4240842.1 heat-inducible transcription repressor HrcA [bacterium]MDP6075472.1 heat-inducible transcriptional repressor HrcA [Myxococcota bacterium]MDP6244248.1 heat-inducible transcriptional repressor HrcA [Myxococcota bacterium]MDP7075920.1 heat-inducible transcriptional repressor HrcA [Myxococcota bacterium]
MSSSRSDAVEFPPLTERQASVLRAVVASYVGAGGPIGSQTIAHLLAAPLSPASVRNTLTELTGLGLVDKPHRSSGRVPTERGLRVFVDTLLAPATLPRSERRDIAYRLDEVDGDRVVSAASELLSHHTRQLGFVIAPRFARMRVRHVSLVRLSTERVLVVLVTASGVATRRVIDADREFDQPSLDRVASSLTERVAGRTLAEVRCDLEREARALRRDANALLAWTLELGRRAFEACDDEEGDLVIATRMALLDQPEFRDPCRLRELFAALEEEERLLEVLGQILEPEGVSVAIGEELDDPGLRRCALVASPYGGAVGQRPLGVLGVIGPSRMDFSRVIPLVDYCSEVVTGRLTA